MDVVVWRIGVDAPQYDAHDLTGVGAQQSGGRWNRCGTPMVYASCSRALACLETLVHLAGADTLPLNRYLVAIAIPASVWAARFTFDAAAQVGWDALPAGRVSLEWGTDWARRLESAVAVVPSVVVPEESNILINPLHDRARGITARKVRRWTYDGRLQP
jgi:RES domain-containing protein